jgi:hypothetical protein
MNRLSTRALIASLVRWFTVPQSAPEMNRRNFLNVQIDAVGVGLASTAAPFLQAFLTRLEAPTVALTALTFMPAIAGLVFSIPLGQFLQTRRNIVPWFSMARLAVLSSYAVTGIISILMPREGSIIGILAIWALATIPQTVLNITFSVVMNSVAGPAGRYELMSHRWSILGFTNAITAILAGYYLDNAPFPANYQIVFIALSVGGLISYYFSSHLTLPDHVVAPRTEQASVRERVHDYFALILSEKPFVSFVVKRFVFLSGVAVASPLFVKYYIDVLHASDFMVAWINIAINITLIFGYFYWSRKTRRSGPQFVLLAATFGVSLYPILIGITPIIWPVFVFAAVYGFFQAGQSLVLFDELMRRIPEEYSATFVALSQALTYISSIIAPLLATVLTETIGFSLTLIIGGVLSLFGFVLFWNEARGAKRRAPAQT